MDFRYYAAFLSEWLGAFSVAWLLSISPRFQKPPLGFKYARREGIIALSLFGLILAFSVAYSILRPPAFPQPLRIAPAPVHDLQQALLISAICLVPFVAALALRQQPVRSLGWDRTLLGGALQVGFAIAILTVFLQGKLMMILSGLPGGGLLTLPLALGISITEETIFRGYIQPRLAWWLSPVSGIALTAALSTLWHLPAWWGRLPVETILLLAALTFVQALVCGWVMRKTGHVAAPALYRTFSIWIQWIG